MRKMGFLGAFALGLMIGFSQAQAAEESANNVSAGSQSTILGVPTEKIYLSFSSTFNGPAVGRPSWESLDRNGSLTGNNMGLYFDSSVTPAYLVSKGVGLGAYIPFFAIPVRGGDMILGDLGGTFFDKTAYSNGGLNISANLTVQGPSSVDSQKRGLLVGFKTSPHIRYSFPTSRFTVGSLTEAKWYAGVKAGKTFKLWATPYSEYRIGPTLSAKVAFEMEAAHLVNDTGYFNFTSQQTNLQPGLVWNVTPNVLVNPFLKVNTRNQVSADSTSACLYINALLL